MNEQASIQSMKLVDRLIAQADSFVNETHEKTGSPVGYDLLSGCMMFLCVATAERLGLVHTVGILNGIQDAIKQAPISFSAVDTVPQAYHIDR